VTAVILENMSRAEKPRVLLVDDNEPTCTLVTALLQREFLVEVAGDGVEAVERLKTGNYASVLLDLRLPQLDGFGVLQFLEENNPAMLRRVLVLTASVTRGELERARSHDICGIIAKPFDVETLLAAVKRCVGLDGTPLSTLIASGMILIIAEILHQRLM
jgi:CheY-like chemotaxis protein